MRSLAWYLDTARARLGAPSDAALSRQLKFEKAAVAQYRNGRAFPSEDVMLRLARLCEISPEEALCELHVWRAEHAQQSERVAVYKRLLARAVAGSVIALGLVAAVPGQSGNSYALERPKLHIMR